MPRKSLEQLAEIAWKRIERAIAHYDNIRRPVYERAWLVYGSDASLLLQSQYSPNIGILGGAIWGVYAYSEDVLGSQPFIPARLNLANTIIHTKLAALTTQKPTFNVLIYDPDKNTPEMISLVRWLIDYLWDDTEVQEALQAAYLSKALFGFGLLEVGEIVEKDSEGNIIGRRLRVTPIPATRVLYDLNARYPSLQACRWMAKIVWMERHVIEDMKEIAQWRHVDEVAPMHKFKPFEDSVRVDQDISVFAEEIEDDKRIPIFYYYDAYEREVFIIAPSKGGDYPYVVLQHMKDPFPFKDFYPFVLIKGYPIPETFHPLSDYHIIEPHLDLLEKFVSIYMNHALRSIPKFAYVENALTEQGRRALSSPSILSGVEVKQASPATVIQPLATEMPNRSLLEMIVLAEKYLNEAAGLTHYHRAEVPPRVKSATESAYLVQLSGVRGQHEAQVLERSLGDLAEKLYGYFLTFGEPVPVKIPTPMGVPMVQYINPNNLPSAVRIEINAGSSAYMDRIQDRNDMIGLLQVLAEIVNMTSGGAAPIALPILQHILTTFPQLNPTDIMQIIGGVMQTAQTMMQLKALQAAAEEEGGEEPETEEPTAIEEIEEPETPEEEEGE